MILWVIFVVVTIACISLARMRIVFTVDPSKLPTVDENTNSNVLMANKYKSSAYLLGWMAVVLLFSGSILLSSKVLSETWMYIFTAITSLIVFVFAGQIKLSGFSMRLAGICAPKLVKTLKLFHPVAKEVDKMFAGWKMPEVTKVISKKELLELLKASQEEGAIRLNGASVDAIKSLLDKDTKISQIMINLDSARVVSSSEAIGPILIDELHKTNQQWFPVKEGRTKQIIGVFNLKNLLDYKEGGAVSDVVDPRMFYVKDNQSLWTVLDAFIKTQALIFFVLDEKSRILGFVSLEDVLLSLLSDKFISDNDSYDDADQIALY